MFSRNDTSVVMYFCKVFVILITGLFRVALVKVLYLATIEPMIRGPFNYVSKCHIIYNLNQTS